MCVEVGRPRFRVEGTLGTRALRGPLKIGGWGGERSEPYKLGGLGGRCEPPQEIFKKIAIISCNFKYMEEVISYIY